MEVTVKNRLMICKRFTLNWKLVYLLVTTSPSSRTIIAESLMIYPIDTRSILPLKLIWCVRKNAAYDFFLEPYY